MTFLQLFTSFIAVLTAAARLDFAYPNFVSARAKMDSTSYVKLAEFFAGAEFGQFWGSLLFTVGENAIDRRVNTAYCLCGTPFLLLLRLAVGGRGADLLLHAVASIIPECF